MRTINLSPSQYRVVRSTVECSSAVTNAVPVPVTARASRMSQANATSAKPTAKANPAHATAHRLPDTHPIYGIVNLALLAVSIYLLWANFL